MKKYIKSFASWFGVELSRIPKLDREAVSLAPSGNKRGRALLGYIIDPFLPERERSNSYSSHTHFGESVQMANVLCELGFAVDIISYRNKMFVPRKDYSIFISARTNFERIALLLPDDCVKIVHLDTAHWLFNNHAAYSRYLALQKRRGVTISSYKIVEENRAIESADYATILGNEFTVGTYKYSGKPTFKLPVPTCGKYQWAEGKDFSKARSQFLWLGSRGFVNKGLDLVLEAFSEMPEYRLIVCGPIQEEPHFVKAYYKELYETENIETVGWIDVCSQAFTDIAEQCAALVYPSCSEGQAGAVVTCLQAGLVPIVSYQSGVDVEDFGIILDGCSRGEIKRSIKAIACLTPEGLEEKSKKAWKCARRTYTLENYAKEFRKIILSILEEHPQRSPKCEGYAGS